MEIIPGSVVYSIAGRDSGRYFLVVSVNDNYAHICDGSLRKVTRPKKKKLKHLKPCEQSDEFITQKLLSDGKLTNREVRKSLSKYNTQNFQSTDSPDKD